MGCDGRRGHFIPRCCAFFEFDDIGGIYCCCPNLVLFADERVYCRTNSGRPALHKNPKTQLAETVAFFTLVPVHEGQN